MANVLVVGAGPVGLTMAAELARHGTRCVLLIDCLRVPLIAAPSALPLAPSNSGIAWASRAI
jgi:2-polyprenyl-6-methoxyphenol hydroxylase-like FAD-dependent oxidoreductase